MAGTDNRLKPQIDKRRKRKAAEDGDTDVIEASSQKRPKKEPIELRLTRSRAHQLESEDSEGQHSATAKLITTERISAVTASNTTTRVRPVNDGVIADEAISTDPVAGSTGGSYVKAGANDFNQAVVDCMDRIGDLTNVLLDSTDKNGTITEGFDAKAIRRQIEQELRFWQRRHFSKCPLDDLSLKSFAYVAEDRRFMTDQDPDTLEYYVSKLQRFEEVEDQKHDLTRVANTLIQEGVLQPPLQEAYQSLLRWYGIGEQEKLCWSKAELNTKIIPLFDHWPDEELVGKRKNPRRIGACRKRVCEGTDHYIHRSRFCRSHMNPKEIQAWLIQGQERRLSLIDKYDSMGQLAAAQPAPSTASICPDFSDLSQSQPQPDATSSTESCMGRFEPHIPAKSVFNLDYDYIAYHTPLLSKGEDPRSVKSHVPAAGGQDPRRLWHEASLQPDRFDKAYDWHQEWKARQSKNLA